MNFFDAMVQAMLTNRTFGRDIGRDITACSESKLVDGAVCPSGACSDDAICEDVPSETVPTAPCDENVCDTVDKVVPCGFCGNDSVWK